MNLESIVAIIVSAMIFAAACERLGRRMGQIPALVRSGVREGRDHGAAIFKETVALGVGEVLRPVTIHNDRLVHVLRVELEAADRRTHAGDRRQDESRALLAASLSVVTELRRLLAETVHAQGIDPLPSGPLPPPPKLPSTRPPGPRLHAVDTARPDAGDGDRESAEELTKVTDQESERRTVMGLPMPRAGVRP